MIVKKNILNIIFNHLRFINKKKFTKNMENASSPFRTVSQINLSFFNSPRKNKTPNNKKNRKNNNSGAASPYYNKNI